MNYLEECFNKGLLRRDKPDIEKAKRSIVRAEHILNRAKAAATAKIPEDALVDAYAAMFHAARALLFKDGIQERSHWGVYVWIREKYSDKLETKFITQFNTLRLERHDIMYDIESPAIGDMEDTIENVRDFIKAVKKLLG